MGLKIKTEMFCMGKKHRLTYKIRASEEKFLDFYA